MVVYLSWGERLLRARSNWRHAVAVTLPIIGESNEIKIYLEVYFFAVFLIQGVPPPADPPKPIFQLIPDRMVLHPGESQNVQLEGYSET